MADVQIQTPQTSGGGSGAVWAVVVVVLLLIIGWFVFGGGLRRNSRTDININTPPASGAPAGGDTKTPATKTP